MSRETLTLRQLAEAIAGSDVGGFDYPADVARVEERLRPYYRHPSLAWLDPIAANEVAAYKGSELGSFVVWGEHRQRCGARGKTIAEAVRAFGEAFPNVRPEEWESGYGDDDGDGGMIVALCESCERPILDGDKYVAYEDGPYECGDCAAEARKHHPPPPSEPNPEGP